jgi:hypothetical protein
VCTRDLIIISPKRKAQKMEDWTWSDPKEAILNLDGFTDKAQQLHNHNFNSKNKGTDVASNISDGQQSTGYQTNMDIDERTIMSNENRTLTPNKRNRILIDGDYNATKSPKNRCTQGDFGNKEHNNRGKFVIHNQNYYNRAFSLYDDTYI